MSTNKPEFNIGAHFDLVMSTNKPEFNMGAHFDWINTTLALLHVGITKN